MNREGLGRIGVIVLAFFLLLFGVQALIAIAIPGWVLGIVAIVAGLLLLVGR